MVRRMLLDVIDLSSNSPFAELFFFLSYRIGNAFIFNKNEGNNQKVGRVGVGRALLTQSGGINLII